jgi:hypothetical protein
MQPAADCKLCINNIEVEHEVVYPNQKEIDATNEWLKHKEDYLLCLSERHPHYKSTSQEIETLKTRIITLKNQ